MRDRLTRFMMGRYGSDPLNNTMMVVALVLVLVSMFFQPVYVLGLLLMVLVLVRMFSRNIAKRQQEAQTFERAKSRVINFFKGIKNRIVGSKTHKYFKCPSCRQQLRAPKGKGKIAITCPKCHTDFTTNT